MRRALEIITRMAATDPENTQWQRDVSSAYVRLGDLLHGQQKFDDALKQYREALAIRERLAAGDANNTDRQFDLGIVHDRLGMILLEQGDLAGALHEYEARRDIIV